VIRAESTGGVTIAVHHFGGTGTPLLISHATGFHAWCYEPMARLLADRFDVWALDYRGHGASTQPDEWDGETLDWRGCGDDAIAALDVIAAERSTDEPIVGFGHSMGAAALLMAAHRRPDAFDRLVLFEPIVFPPADGPADPESFPLVVGARRRRNRFDSVEAAFQNFAGKPPISWFEHDVLRAYVDHGLRPAGDGDGDGVELCCEGRFEAATFAGSMTNGVWDLLPSIETPALVLSGVVEPDQPSRIAADVAAQLPRGAYRNLPHQTHFGPFTHVAEVAALIGGGA
jgi:pimeloyl-ACP methyl ester carboxylesterase